MSTRSVFDKAENFIRGIFIASSRNIERISEELSENYFQLQHFISDSTWDSRTLLDRISLKVSEVLPKEKPVALIIDESGMVKKGTHSVGVSKQYCGNIGKIENSQVAVFGCLASGDFSCLVDTRLYLPECWTSDEKRCKKAGIPVSQRIFKTKIELALEIIFHQRSIGANFDYVVFDGYYGKDLFMQEELNREGIKFIGDFPTHQHIYLMRPSFKVPKARKGRGRKPIHKKPTVKSMSGNDYINGLFNKDYTQVSIRRTTKGRLKAFYHVRDIYLCDELGEKVYKRTMIIKKQTDSKGRITEIKCSLSNMPGECYSIKQLAVMQNQRFFIEHSFRESKHELGMDQFQTRKWNAWYHQIALIILSLFLILKEKITCFFKWPLLSARDIRQIAGKQWEELKTFGDILIQLNQRHRKRQLDINRYQSFT